MGNGVTAEDEVVTYDRANRKSRNWVRAAPLLRGVVNRLDPRWIPEDAFVEGLNVDLQDPARPRKRDGYVVTESGSEGLLASVRLSGLGYLDAGPASQLLVAAQSGASGFASGGRVAHVRHPSVQSWSEATGSQPFNVNTDDCKMFQGNFLLYLLTGAGANMAAMTTSGELIDLGNENGSPPTGAVDGVYLFERVWLLDGNRLYWSKIQPVGSDLEDKTAFDRAGVGPSTIAGSFTLSPPFGGLPTSMEVWNNRSLVIFYDTSALEVVVDNSDPLNSVINILEPRYGCSSRGSVASVGREIFFLDQYGDYRAMAQTVTGAQQGMLAEPISESIKPAFPGDVTPGFLRKVKAFFFGDILYLMYPKDPSPDINACWLLDMNRRAWYGPYVFADSFSAVVIADFIGSGNQIFAASASPSKPVAFRLFPGTFSDDGVGIKYRETGRMHHGGLPEKNKQPRFVECWAKGETGSSVKVRLRTSEDSVWTRVLDFALESSASIFPIAEAGFPGSIFPIAEAGDPGSPFPIKEPIRLLTRGFENLEDPIAGEFPIPNSAFAIPSTDFDILDAGGGVIAGRFVQWQVEEESSASFERQAVHVAMDVQETVRDSEA